MIYQNVDGGLGFEGIKEKVSGPDSTTTR
jgi:hypothetical protein